MAFIIYPEGCKVDNIRKQEIDLTNPLNQWKIYPQLPNPICALCAPGQRIIANGNRFDGIEARSE